MTMSDNPFKLRFSEKVRSAPLKSLVTALEPKIEKLSSLNILADSYEKCFKLGMSSDDFTDHALKELNITYDISDKDFQNDSRNWPCNNCCEPPLWRY